MKIQPNCLVELDYEILDGEGNVVDNSTDSGPLEFVQGGESIPPGLAAALDGKEAGDEVEVSFGPGEAFGEFNPEGIVSVPREEFGDDVPLEPGLWVEVQLEEGDGDEEDDVLEMRIVEVEPDAVILDANHPLSNEPVTFRVRVRAVRSEE